MITFLPMMPWLESDVRGHALYSSDDPNCEAEHPVSGLTSRLIATQRGSSRPLPPTGEACGTHRHSPPPSPAWGMGEAEVAAEVAAIVVSRSCSATACRCCPAFFCCPALSRGRGGPLGAMGG